MEKLSTSELVVAEKSSSNSAGSWLSNYANDLLLHPANHLPEMAVATVATVGVGVAAAIGARRLLSEGTEVAAKAITKDTSARSSAAAETFVRMDKRSVEEALQTLRTRDGLEITAWGNTQIEGSRGAGLSVLRASDLAALQIRRDANTVYAHKISINHKGETVASYYTNSPLNLRNPWAPDETKVWPLYKGGPFDGLQESGVQIMDLATKPRGLHFSPKLDSLSIKWTDLRAIDSRLAGAKAVPENYWTIDVHGANSVMQGKGQIILNPAKGL